MADTYVTLADGKRVGPLREAMIYIGSDPRCAVRLPAGGAVRPVHAHLSRGASGAWTIGPGEAGAAIFLVEGENRVRRLTSATALRSGDRVLLGGTSGPALTLDDGQPAAPREPLPATPTYAPPTPRPAASTPASRNRVPTSDAIANEIARRAEVEAMRNGTVQDLSRFWYRWKSGTFMRPDVIVGSMISLFTALCGFCGGGGGAVWLLWQKLTH